MTRVNLIPAKLLTDQHLRSELREIPRIITHVHKLWLSGKYNPNILPATYVLGTGHVRFFYNKLSFIMQRIRILNKQCLVRKFKGINESYYALLKKCYAALPAEFKQHFEPTASDISISQERIFARVEIKISWYKYLGKSLTSRIWNKLLTKIKSLTAKTILV